MISINKLQVQSSRQNDIKANPEIKCLQIIQKITPRQRNMKEIELKT